MADSTDGFKGAAGCGVGMLEADDPDVGYVDPY